MNKYTVSDVPASSKCGSDVNIKSLTSMDDSSPSPVDTKTDNKIRPSSANGAPPQAHARENGVSRSEAADQADVDEEAIRKQKQRRERDPLLYCKLVAKWPLRAFLITLSGHVSMIVISVALLLSGYDLLPVDFENLPLEINDEPWRPRDLAFRQRDDISGYYERVSGASVYRSQEYRRASIDLYYDGEGANVFRKDVLEQIQYFENQLTQIPEYNLTWCKVNKNNTACEKPISIIRYFDGSFRSISPVFDDPFFDNITGVVYEAYTTNATKGMLQFFLGKGFEITQTSVFNPITRSKIVFGYPLKAYDSLEDYQKAARAFSADQMKPILKDIRDSASLFEFSYRSDMLWIEDVFNQAMKDVMCAIGSICFIFVFIFIHTRSLWITALAVFSIITCFLATNIIYVVVLGFRMFIFIHTRSLWITALAVFSIITCFLATNIIYVVVLGFRYLGFFHVLTIFIVLGIGADDVFVFYDVWRNTAYEAYPTLAHRLSDAYRKSVKSMFFTSLTTAVAFFANAISPLLATRSFGVFSGLVIVVNYISIILYFPTVVIMYHTKFEKFKWPCQKICKRRHEPETEATEESKHSVHNDPCVFIMNPEKPTLTGDDSYHYSHGVMEKNKMANGKAGHMTELGTEIGNHKFEKMDLKPGTGNGFVSNGGVLPNGVGSHGDASNGFVNGGFQYDSENQSHSRHEMQIQQPASYMTPKNRKRKSRIVKFFRYRYSAFVTHKVGRWVILAFTLGVLGFFISQAAKLEPDNEGLKVLKDSHVYSIAASHATDSFVQSNSDRTLEIYILWGFLPNDMSDCHFSTPKCPGRQRVDTTFDPSTPAAQLAVKNFCETMQNFPAATGDDFRLKTDYVTGHYKIDCYITSLGDFLDEETAITGTNWSLPFNYSRAVSFMDAMNLQTSTPIYNSTGFNDTYRDYLEIPISHWLSNSHTEDFVTYDPIIGEQTGTFSRAFNNDTTKFYGNDLRYVAVKVTTTMVVANLGFTDGLPILNRWEDFVNSEMKKMPAGMENGFQLSWQIWHWLHVQEMLAENAVYGVAIGVCLAFPLLTIATMNIITGTLATLSMCCSTICVIGVIPLGGWKLGVLESLNMCMVVGLTVDYVVHLAEGYTLSLHKTRAARLRDMLDEMAISILFGACTTLGASMFMFIAQLSFFFQFGIFMFSTILFSLFFSMLMFVTLMGLIGPQNNAGNLLVLFRGLCARCKGDRAGS